MGTATTSSTTSARSTTATVEWSPPCRISTSRCLPALLQLATDGCSPPDGYPPTAWPLIDQVVTAQLRYDFGEATTVDGLGPGLGAAYPRLHVQVTTGS